MNSNMKHTYRKVLIGFEKYSFSEAVMKAMEPEFEQVVHDYNACQNCDGTVCRTWLNHNCSDWYRHMRTRQEKCNNSCYPEAFRGYYALWHKGCKEDKPAFTVFPCPGVAVRREQIVQALTSYRREAS